MNSERKFVKAVARGVSRAGILRRLALLLVSACGSVSATAQTSGFVYVANEGGNVSAYTIDGTTGALTAVPGSPFPAGSLPTSVTVDPTGRFAYVANSRSDNVSAYIIDGTTGALVAVAGSPFPTSVGPFSVTVDPTGRFAYVASCGPSDCRDSGEVAAYTIDGATGALTAVAGSPFPAGTTPISVAVDPTGQFAYVANLDSHDVSAYTIDGTTGALTAVPGSPTPAGQFPASVTVDPTGQFAYVATGSGGGFVLGNVIKRAGGLLPLCSAFPAGPAPRSVTVDPTGQFAYVANRVSINVSAYTIDGTTGALTAVPGSPFPARPYPAGITATAGPAAPLLAFPGRHSGAYGPAQPFFGTH